MLRQISQTQPFPALSADTVVLDIETSGLSRTRDAVRLAGVATPEGLTQWIADAPADEPALLRALAVALDGRTILTYNGQAFDLPFLEARWAAHGIPAPRYLSEDFYVFLRAHQSFFRFPDLKLTTLGNAAGITRRDALSGDEVAAIFSTRLSGADTPGVSVAPRGAGGAVSTSAGSPDELSPADRDAVLLHNAEDVRITGELLPFFVACKDRLRLGALPAILDTVRYHGDFAFVTYRSEIVAGTEHSFENSFGRLLWAGDALEVTLPVHRVLRPDLPAAARGDKRPAREDQRVAAVSPRYSADPAAPPLPAPFVTLRGAEGHYAESFHLLTSELLELAGWEISL